MPYKIISELPPPVKDNLPAKAQEIFMAAYNSAWEKHGKENNAEIICNAIAWAAVKQSYTKNADDKWVAKESKKPLETPLAQGVDIVEINCPNLVAIVLSQKGTY